MRNTDLKSISCILTAVFILLPTVIIAEPVNDSFSHSTTGFRLTGGHRAVECDACHNNGIFRGTEKECSTCHSALMNTGAVVKSGFHIQTSNQCETCHSTLVWDDVRRVNHMAVLGDCKSCHYTGSTSGGPPTNLSHTTNTQDCIVCHRTSTWFSVHFNHTGETCTNCHNTPPTINGITATLPPGDTIHTGTTLGCNSCHTTSNWRFNHNLTPGYPVGHRDAPCGDCHFGGYTQAGTYTNVTYAGSCAGCHSDKYVASKHNNVPIGTNQNCLGSGCHNYSGW